MKQQIQIAVGMFDFQVKENAELVTKILVTV